MEAEGQAVAQPSVGDQALSIADSILSEETPKKEPQKAAPKEVSQEVKEEEIPVDPPIELSEEETEPPRKHKLTVKVEGGADEEIEIEEPELHKGYMRQSDYQRKTAEVARMREAAQEQIKQGIDPVVKQYSDQLVVLENAVRQFAGDTNNVDWNKLAVENPAEWAARMQQQANVNSVMENIHREQAQIAAKIEQDRQISIQKQIQESRRILSEEIPGWNDQLYQGIMKFGIDKYGYTPEEVKAETDARAIKVLYAAQQWEKLQAAKPEMEKRIAAVPKVAKPGTTEKSDPNRDQARKDMALLKKTGSQDAALAVARRFFE